MTPQPGLQLPPQKYTLPTLALIFSILGLCLCPSALVGVVLAIVALVRISKEPQLSGKGLAIAALIVPVGVVPIIGIYAAIAIPNFIRFQARSKQAECKINLRAMSVAQRNFYAENDRWATSFDELQFTPEGNRYSYFLSPTEVLPADTRKFPSLASEDHLAPLDELRVFGDGQEAELVMACVGNVDSDPTLDVWTLTSTGDGGELGVPTNLRNDIEE